MRKHEFELTIAKRLLGLALTTAFLLIFFGATAGAEKTIIIPLTIETERDLSSHAEMTTTAAKQAWYTTTIYTIELTSEVYSDVHATYEKKTQNMTVWRG